LDGTVGVDDDSISLPNLQGDQMVWNVFIAIKDNETSTAVVNGTRITLETFYDYWIILYPNYAAAFNQILLDHNVEYQRDSLESDDNYSDATWIETDGSTYHHSYYPAADEDWSKFNATAGVEYLIKTRNLANGADTMLRVYDTDGTTLLHTNDDENSDSVSSSIIFTAPSDAVYYVITNRSADAIPIGKYGDFDITIYDINHPSILSLNPSMGSVNGGFTVDISGTNFESGATVKFGVYLATEVTWNSDTSLTVTVPTNVPGFSDITVTNPLTTDGISPEGTSPNLFEYTGNPLDPVITSISPDFGDYTASTEVTITGDYLIDGLSLSLGSNTMSSVTVVDAKTIQATIQSISRGVHTVVATNPNGVSSSIINGYESTLTEMSTLSTTSFTSSSGIQNTISITENIRISDLYVHVNFTSSTTAGSVNLTLESPSGDMISLFDRIQVAKNPWQDGWRTEFDVIFGSNFAPSEALYRLKGTNSVGDWTLHAESTTSNSAELHNWGLSFFEYRHKEHSDIAYCAAEYRNHVMAVDSVTGELLFRSRYEGAYGNAMAISNDGRTIFSGGSTYHDGTSWENTLLYAYDSWTGEIIDSYQLSGRMDSGSIVQSSNGSLLVVTSKNLYQIDLINKTVIETLQ
jgi:hypothetical protein